MRLRLAHELLDEDEGTPAEVARSLQELWWINRRLGGLSTWRTLLRCWQAQEEQHPPLWSAPSFTLLDVGAGTGEMAHYIANELCLAGAPVRAVALDRRSSHLGAGAGLRVAGDACRLPFADASFDLVTCNLFLHHFHDQPGAPAATRLLRELARVARRAVLVNDLQRGWIPWAVIQALSPRFSRITRHDGPRSVAQAYTRQELAALARGCGFTRFRAVRLWPYRLGLILWCGDAL
ncbi:MAG: methyltransferase domain-containing protein [Terriglobales bacterium]